MKEVLILAALGIGFWFVLDIFSLVCAIEKYYKARARLLDAKAVATEKGYHYR